MLTMRNFGMPTIMLSDGLEPLKMAQSLTKLSVMESRTVII